MAVQSLVIANWKMNGNRQLVADMGSALTAFAQQAPGLQITVCPPATLLAALQTQLADSSVAVGAQNVNAHAKGAHTGELAMQQVQEFGSRYILVGHSERRQSYGETDTDVAAKVKTIVAAGAIAVICVGETAAQREADETKTVIAKQLQAALSELPASVDATQLVIAYEPVWAIGTGLTASPEQAQDVHAFIRAELKQLLKTDATAIALLYGGSVKPDNAASLFAQQDINGGLIGGASLVVEDFLAICNAAQATE